MIAILLDPPGGQMQSAELRDEIAMLCRRAGLDADIRETRGLRDVRDAAREALAKHADAIVAGGGDSTVSAVATVLAGQTVPLGVLPLGTQNQFAQDLDIPADRERALAIVASHRLRHVDVGRVNDRVFVSHSSIGAYPSIVEARERLVERGRSKWAARALATLEVLRRNDELAIRLEAGGQKTIARTTFVFSRVDGRRVRAQFAPPLRTHHVPNLLAHAVFDRTGRDRLLTAVAAAELWIDTPFVSAISVACDGASEMMRTPLHYRSWPGALRVIAPSA